MDRDQPVANRAVKTSLNLLKVIKYWEPSFSYAAEFFKSYLVSFQTDSLMVSFLSDEIEKLFWKLSRLAMKPEVVDEATTPYKLIKINVSDKNIQKEYIKTIICTAATNDLRDNYIKCDIKN